MSALSAVDRSRPPAPDDLKPFSFPPFERRRLCEGLDLYAAALHRSPLIHLQLMSPSGGQFDPPRKPGLASLTAAVLDEGTSQHSSSELAHSAERLGGYLSSSASWDGGEISTGLLSRHLAAGLDLIAEVATTPTFPEAEIDRLKALTLAELQRRRAQPAALGAACFSRALYGSGVYGTPLIGSTPSVRDLTRQDCVSFYERHQLGGPAALIAVGDLDVDELAGRATRLLEGSVGRRAAPQVPFNPVAPESHRVLLVDRPDAAQTELCIGQVGISRSHPDYLIAAVMNSLLGGSFMSRINLNLRERNGFTYGAGSRFSKRLGPGPFSVTTALGNDVVGAATREVLHELRRVCEEPVSTDELEDIKSFLLGVFPYTVQTYDGIAARLQDLAVFSLPLNHFDTFPGRLAAITPGDILRVARQSLRPEAMVIVAVGPSKALAPQLEELGPVEFWQIDSE